MTLQVQTTETLFYIFLDFLLFVCNTAYLMTKKILVKQTRKLLNWALLGWPICQKFSDLHISNSFEKLRSFYTKLILIIFFYSGSKGSRNSPKVLHYPKEKWVLQVYFYFPLRCMHLTLNRNIPIMPISLFWDNAKMCKTLDQFRDPLNMVQE